MDGGAKSDDAATPKKLHKKKEAKKALQQTLAVKKQQPLNASRAQPGKSHSATPAFTNAARVPAHDALLSSSTPIPVDAKRKQQKIEAAAAPYRTLVLTDLCGDLRPVYSRMLRKMMPNIQKQIPNPTILEESDGAIVTLEVESRAVADQIFRRMQNANVFGRRLKVEFHDADVLRCSPAPVLVDIRLSAPTTCAAVSKLLSTVQGFLAVASSDGLRTGDDDATSRTMIATFADEGSALHARAVLSGRILGASGTHMFLSRR
jgi:hypothetical protein